MSGSGIWAFIGLIVLISIITGVSLHDAFWGIVAFAGGVTVFFVALAIIYYTSSAVAKKIKAANTPEGRKIRALKRHQRIADAKNDATIGLMFLWAVSPLLIAVLLATTADSFTKDHPQVYLLAVAPFIAGLVSLFILGTKGQNGKQRLKSLGKFSWKIIKLFLITFAVIAGLGLIFVLVGNLQNK